MTIKQTVIRFSLFLIVAALFINVSAPALAQSTYTVTTLSQPISSTSQRNVIVASATNISGPNVSITQGGIGAPVAGTTTMLYVDGELMRVQAVNGTSIQVQRGVSPTRAVAHLSGATVFVGPASYFPSYDPYGSCTSSTQSVLPFIVPLTKTAWNCVGSIWTPTSYYSFPLNNAVNAATETFALAPNLITDGGANNAITGNLTDALSQNVPLATGLMVTVKLGHTLQAGANTFALNGGSAKAIKSHLNAANNIGTAYAATGYITMVYDGVEWLDLSQ